eukprot:508278_1
MASFKRITQIALKRYAFIGNRMNMSSVFRCAYPKRTLHLYSKRFQHHDASHYQQFYRYYGPHGITFGSSLAIVISYNHYQSVLWACVHGCFSWLYVVYFVMTN